VIDETGELLFSQLVVVEKEAKVQHGLDQPVVVEVDGPLIDEVVRRTSHPSYHPHTPAG
jgi:hypothetical protein